MSTEAPKTTPMMVQWQACKEQAKDALVLFRLGEFYEAFFEDALVLSQQLDVTLTQRQEVPMSGVPAHAAEGYIDKLVEKGYKVAIAEQIEDSVTGKGLVRREIVRVITPGTILTSSLLQTKQNNFLVSLTQVNSLFGLAFLDLSTGEFHAEEVEDIRSVLDELFRYRPKEILVAEKCHAKYGIALQEFLSATQALCNVKAQWHYEHSHAYRYLMQHFQVQSLDGFGLKGMTVAVNAAGALLSYVAEDLHLPIEHIEHIHAETLSKCMAIDRTAQRHLELVESVHPQAKGTALIPFLDDTQTPMGSRLFRHWFLHPLLCPKEIQIRQDATATLVAHPEKLRDLRVALGQIRDIERLLMRVTTGYAFPKDLHALRLSLEHVPQVVELLQAFGDIFFSGHVAKCAGVITISGKIARVVTDDPPVRLSDGGVIRSGVHAELDELRDIQIHGRDWVAQYQTTLRTTMGIKTLKVGYTQAFGYYIEVSRGQSEKMPDSFQRRQTLINAERYISPQLKEFENKILSAAERISAIEAELFHHLREEISAYGTEIRAIARAIAQIDAIHSFAYTASLRRYARPTVDKSDCLEIVQGRHPILEGCLPEGSFVPNNVQLDPQQQLLLVTGPNMAGKSTYIRQIALLAIMAQTGSFIPATQARIGIIDKVFSRIGASDDLARGQSTFMVEMSETANILHNATSRSLVILDEIGRGTSTYDGIAIAWAVAEYLLTTPGKRAKTLFATHYWELHQLATLFPHASNCNVAVHESATGIAFLHTIVAGGTDKSYGIHVAKLAGLPHAAIQKAQEMLAKMEKGTSLRLAQRASLPKQQQLDLFAPTSQDDFRTETVVSEIRHCDLEQTTPMDALQKLARWQKYLFGE